MTREEYLARLQDDPAFVKKCLIAIDSLQDRRENGQSKGVWMGWKGTDLRKATMLVTKMRYEGLTPLEIKQARELVETYYPQIDRHCKLA
jgi:hypothetical protein